MGYSYSVCTCNECVNMDLNDRYRYDNNKAYCTKRREYYNLSEKACYQYFIYDENRKNTSSSCYLTTIICDTLGFNDNCIYLETLRNFRDEYMKKNVELLPILLEYDIVGPILSKKIKEDSFNKTKCLILFETYIKRTVECIINEKYSNAINIYNEMVQALKSVYDVPTPNIEINDNIDLSSVGKGHRLVYKKI